MKNVIIAAVLSIICFSAFGQSYRVGSFQHVRANGTVIPTNDTTTDTDTTYLWSSRTDFNQWQSASLQYIATNVTDTTTASIVVQGSNDATTAVNGTWTTLANNTTGSIGLVDTGTAVATTYVFHIPNGNYKRLRIRMITGGTQTSYINGTYYLGTRYTTQVN